LTTESSDNIALDPAITSQDDAKRHFKTLPPKQSSFRFPFGAFEMWRLDLFRFSSSILYRASGIMHPVSSPFL
jgi:hypothetical protein